MSALPYAHLLGMSATKVEDDDGMKQGVDESDEDYAKRMEDEEKKKEEDAKKAKKAEDEKKKEDADKGDDDVDNGDGDDKKEKAARQNERARCAAIFSCSAAGARPDMAAHLAFNTDMNAKAATDMLQAIAAGTPAAAGGLAQRMSAVKTPNVGSGAGASVDPSSPAGIAATIIAAGKARRGEA
ncbi:hypothetical protein [Janthinobacterium sp.]|uniref:hypothetical protein n=1 Tax=Janthinobacterium sp. TaxID=1871054 RepID=UPI00293D6805|nr:hypothetical protein [Janthinobacterium sp.]